VAYLCDIEIKQHLQTLFNITSTCSLQYFIGDCLNKL